MARVGPSVRRSNKQSQLHPDDDFSKELDGDEHVPQSQTGAPTSTGTNRSVADELGVNKHSTYEPGMYATGKGKSPDTLAASGSSATFTAASPENEDEPFTSHWPSDVINAMRENHVANPIDHYYGQSSGARLFNTALLVRSEIEGTDQDVMHQVAQSTKIRTDFWKPHPVWYTLLLS